jgi:hypothetical protein
MNGCSISPEDRWSVVMTEKEERDPSEEALEVTNAEEVLRRLRILQIYAGVERQEDMAARLGITLGRWGNYMSGGRPFKPNGPNEIALLIRSRFREITLEWLWLGETDLLTRREPQAEGGRAKAL